MPRLSAEMEEARILAWLVDDGTQVGPGQAFVEIEADKATAALALEVPGVLRIGVGAGTTVLPGAEIARIDGPHAQDAVRPVVAATACRVAPSAEPAAAVAEVGAPGGARISAAAVDAGASVGSRPADRAGNGSAPEGSPVGGSAIAALDGVADPRESRRPATGLERVVARRMARSRSEIPEFTVTVEVDLHATLALRADMRTAGPSGGGRVPSVNDLVVRAAALALRDHPRINSRWEDGEIVDPGRIDVGVAVATDDDGLVVPVLRDADRVPLGELAATARDLTRRARTGEATPAELAGATFSISNLGMLGVAHFTAVIGPRQGAILAVGAAAQRYVPVDGQPTLRPIAQLTLTADHRVIYGAHAAAYLDRLRTLLEHPAGLAL